MVPVLVVFDEFAFYGVFACIVAVACLEPTDIGDRGHVEGNVVFRLGTLVDVLDDDVDGFAGIGFVKVDVADEIDVSEDLWGFEVAGKYLSGLFGDAGVLRSGGGEVSVCEHNGEEVLEEPHAGR